MNHRALPFLFLALATSALDNDQPHHSVSGGILTQTKSEMKSNSNEESFYILSVSYLPEFCYQHRFKKFVGCLHFNSFWTTQLTIHGLWPQFANGSWPSTCTNEHLNETILSHDIGFDLLDLLWPNVESTRHSNNNNKSNNDDDYLSFWEHEWSKHGTCSGLNQQMYFSLTLQYWMETKTWIGSFYGSQILKQSLIQSLDNHYRISLQCSHGKYLEGVHFCFRHNGDRMNCPETVLSKDTCFNEMIVLTKFYSEPASKIKEEDVI